MAAVREPTASDPLQSLDALTRETAVQGGFNRSLVSAAHRTVHGWQTNLE